MEDNNLAKSDSQVDNTEQTSPVRVTFNIPIAAAQRLRLLAQQDSEVLRSLGILEIKLEGEEEIALTVLNQNNDVSEIRVRQSYEAPGSSSSSGSLSFGGSQHESSRAILSASSSSPSAFQSSNMNPARRSTLVSQSHLVEPSNMNPAGRSTLVSQSHLVGPSNMNPAGRSTLVSQSHLVGPSNMNPAGRSTLVSQSHLVGPSNMNPAGRSTLVSQSHLLGPSNMNSARRSTLVSQSHLVGPIIETTQVIRRHGVRQPTSSTAFAPVAFGARQPALVRSTSNHLSSSPSLSFLRIPRVADSASPSHVTLHHPFLPRPNSLHTESQRQSYGPLASSSPSGSLSFDGSQHESLRTTLSSPSSSPSVFQSPNMNPTQRSSLLVSQTHLVGPIAERTQGIRGQSARHPESSTAFAPVPLGTRQTTVQIRPSWSYLSASEFLSVLRNAGVAPHQLPLHNSFCPGPNSPQTEGQLDQRDRPSQFKVPSVPLSRRGINQAETIRSTSNRHSSSSSFSGSQTLLQVDSAIHSDSTLQTLTGQNSNPPENRLRQSDGPSTSATPISPVTSGELSSGVTLLPPFSSFSSLRRPNALDSGEPSNPELQQMTRQTNEHSEFSDEQYCSVQSEGNVDEPTSTSAFASMLSEENQDPNLRAVSSNVPSTSSASLSSSTSMAPIIVVSPDAFNLNLRPFADNPFDRLELSDEIDIEWEPEWTWPFRLVVASPPQSRGNSNQNP